MGLESTLDTYAPTPVPEVTLPPKPQCDADDDSTVWSIVLPSGKTKSCSGAWIYSGTDPYARCELAGTDGVNGYEACPYACGCCSTNPKNEVNTDAYEKCPNLATDAPSVSSQPSDIPSISPSLSSQPSDVPSISPSLSSQPTNTPTYAPDDTTWATIRKIGKSPRKCGLYMTNNPWACSYMGSDNKTGCDACTTTCAESYACVDDAVWKTNEKIGRHQRSCGLYMYNNANQYCCHMGSDGGLGVDNVRRGCDACVGSCADSSSCAAGCPGYT